MKEVLDEWNDLIKKSKKDITKLVPVQKVITRGGKTMTTTVYVNPEEAKQKTRNAKKYEGNAGVVGKKVDAVDVQSHLKPIRKNLGVDKYKEYLKANGVKWEENKENAGADTMRASMAAKKWIEAGNKLDHDLYQSMLKGDSGKPKEKVDDGIKNKELISKLTEGTEKVSDKLGGYGEQFGDITVEGLERVFNPDPSKFEVTATSLYETTHFTGRKDIAMAFSIKADGKVIGKIERKLTFADSGIDFKSEQVAVEKSHQNSKIGLTLHKNQEDLLRHLSKGKPVKMTLDAASVGRYVWANYGYTCNEGEMKSQHDLFKRFCSEILEKDPADVLKDCGYNDISDIKYMWQFSALDDSKTYDTATKGKTIFSSGKHVKGKGHLGKKFMLATMMWSGEKWLNGSDDAQKNTEAIGELYYKNKG